MSKTILIDFDNTISQYSKGCEGDSVCEELPIEGTRDAIKELRKTYKVVVFTARAKTEGGLIAIHKWFKRWNIVVDEITKHKVPASIIADGLAIYFRGDWKQTLQEVDDFFIKKEKPIRYSSGLFIII